MYKIDVGWWFFIGFVLDIWVLSMIADMGKAIKLCIKGEDWRIPAYEFCGKVFLTIFSVIVGFWMLTGG